MTDSWMHSLANTWNYFPVDVVGGEGTHREQNRNICVHTDTHTHTHTHTHTQVQISACTSSVYFSHLPFIMSAVESCIISHET